MTDVVSQRDTDSARKAVVILGMHRSGTSALTHLVTQLGGDGPATPMGASEDNPKGHFESVRLYELQEEILASAGSSWDDYRPFASSWMMSPKAADYRGKLREVLQAEYGSSAFFVIKDPRICRLLPLWRTTLSGLHVTPLFVHTHRDPLEVSRSLQRRNGFDLDYGYLLWLRHVLDAESGSRGSPRSFTSYDRLLHAWPAEIEKIAVDLDITWPRYSQFQASELNGVIEPGLRRNMIGRDNLAGSRIFSNWIREVREVFESWANDGENPADLQQLDDIRSAFDESSALFHGVVHSRAAGLAAQHTEACLKTAAAEARSAALDDETAALQAERAGLLARLGWTENELAQSRAALEGANGDLQATREALHVAEAGRLADMDSLNQAGGQITTLQADVLAYGQALSSAEARGAALEAEAVALRGEREGLVERQDRAESELAQGKEALESADGERRALREALRAAEAARADDVEALGQANAQIEALQADIASRVEALSSAILDHEDRIAAAEAARAEQEGISKALAKHRDRLIQQGLVDRTEIAQRERALEGARDDLRSTRDALEQMAEAMAKLQAEVIDCKLGLAERDSVILACKTQIAATGAERDVALRTAAVAESSRAAQELTIAGLIGERCDLLDQRRINVGQIAQAKADLEAARRECWSAQDDVAARDKKVAALLTDVSDREEELVLRGDTILHYKAQIEASAEALDQALRRASKAEASSAAQEKAVAFIAVERDAVWRRERDAERRYALAVADRDALKTELRHHAADYEELHQRLREERVQSARISNDWNAFQKENVGQKSMMNRLRGIRFFMTGGKA